MTFFLDLAQIVLIDLSLAADNALVVGAAVATLPASQRNKALTAGIAAATILRIVMAFFAVQLLHITGLLAAGGLLLLWVGWKMLREVHLLKHPQIVQKNEAQKMTAAIWQIIVADVSMSLDNVLGVAGIARDHMEELVLGLALSVALMGLVSSQIAKFTERYPKAGYVGIAIVVFTAVRMIYDGVIVFYPTHAFV